MLSGQILRALPTIWKVPHYITFFGQVLISNSLIALPCLIITFAKVALAIPRPLLKSISALKLYKGRIYLSI